MPRASHVGLSTCRSSGFSPRTGFNSVLWSRPFLQLHSLRCLSLGRQKRRNRLRTRFVSMPSIQSKWRGPKSSSRHGRNPSSRRRSNQVTKHLEDPQVQFPNKVDELPVDVQRQIPMVQTAQKTMEIL